MATETILAQALVAAGIIIVGGLRAARRARRHLNSDGCPVGEKTLQTLIIRLTDLRKTRLLTDRRKLELDAEVEKEKLRLGAELEREKLELGTQLEKHRLDLIALEISAHNVPPGGAIDIRRPRDLMISIHGDRHDPRGTGLRQPPTNEDSPTASTD